MKTKLVVNINAQFDWDEPPKDKTEEFVRIKSNIMARNAAKKLEQAVQLMILEFLNAQELQAPSEVSERKTPTQY